MKLPRGQQVAASVWLLLGMSSDKHEGHRCWQASHLIQADMYKDGLCWTLAQVVRSNPWVN